MYFPPFVIDNRLLFSIDFDEQCISVYILFYNLRLILINFPFRFPVIPGVPIELRPLAQENTEYRPQKHAAGAEAIIFKPG